MVRSRIISRMLPLLLLAGASHVPTGCDCSYYPPLVVQVRDGTGQPAALGATGLAVFQGGAAAALVSSDSLTLIGIWGSQGAGRYSVEVRKPGFRMVYARTEVDDGSCGHETRTLRIRIDR